MHYQVPHQRNQGEKVCHGLNCRLEKGHTILLMPVYNQTQSTIIQFEKTLEQAETVSPSLMKYKIISLQLQSVL